MMVKSMPQRRTGSAPRSAPRPDVPGLGAVVLAVLGGLALAGPAAAGASDWQREMGGAIRLITADGPAAADGSRMAGVEIRMEPGWKTYWRFPGDSGVGTSVDLGASTNFTAAELAFPAPKRLEDEYATSIGYAGSVVLPLRVIPAEPSQPTILRAEVSYGLCEQVCLPVTSMLEARLEPDTPEDPAAAAAIAAAQAAVPVPVAAGAPLSVTDVEVVAGAEPHLRIAAKLADPEAPVDLFAEGPEGSYITVPSLASRTLETAIFTLPLEGLVVKDGDAALRLTLVNGERAVEQDWPLDPTTLP